ncbi:MAG: DUF3592 domain-containing protein [Anaerolineae bacterium]|jgi:hypothetical protein|nr:DUF3592 domain-containing protein [Anaerolineae bacterium]MBT7070783.1 DUF3592 domain-containing protein [Anaerolineae bacterium]MBT7325027.1 DUF3592 domain-containing protein [Anaerolineae bacterium]
MIVSILAGGFILVVFGIIGAVMIYKYFQEKKDAEESLGWSSTVGRITKSLMRRETSYESSNTLYYPEVEYTYEFLGTEYTGDRITFGGSTGNSNRNKSEETLAKYPVGENITVYYDPNNPEDAALERKIGLGGKVFLIVGILFVFLAFCVFCIGIVAAGISLLNY